MGLFNSYLKPGKGIDKDRPRKKGFFLYFEIFFRKFSKLCLANILYFVFSIPNIIITSLILMFVLGGIFTGIADATYGVGTNDANVALITLNVLATMFFVFLWGTGPASAAFAYITRCFTREEHAWIWSDFVKIYKENFKNGILLCIVDYIAMAVMLFSMVFYLSFFIKDSNVMWLIFAYISFLMFMIYTFMHYHIYQLMVTYTGKFRDYIKNGLMLAIGKAPMNLVLSVFVIFVLLILTAYININPFFLIVISSLIFFGFLRFPIEFYSARAIQKLNVTIKEEQ